MTQLPVHGDRVTNEEALLSEGWVGHRLLMQVCLECQFYSSTAQAKICPQLCMHSFHDISEETVLMYQEAEIWLFDFNKS